MGNKRINDIPERGMSRGMSEAAEKTARMVADKLRGRVEMFDSVPTVFGGVIFSWTSGRGVLLEIHADGETGYVSFYNKGAGQEVFPVNFTTGEWEKCLPK